MVKHGKLFTCERCGKGKFVEDGDFLSGENAPTDWGKHEGKHLCPTCTDLYNKIMNNFFAPEVKRPINLED